MELSGLTVPSLASVKLPGVGKNVVVLDVNWENGNIKFLPFYY